MKIRQLNSSSRRQWFYAQADLKESHHAVHGGYAQAIWKPWPIRPGASHHCWRAWWPSSGCLLTLSDGPVTGSILHFQQVDNETNLFIWHECLYWDNSACSGWEGSNANCSPGYKINGNEIIWWFLKIHLDKADMVPVLWYKGGNLASHKDLLEG